MSREEMWFRKSALAAWRRLEVWDSSLTLWELLRDSQHWLRSERGERQAQEEGHPSGNCHLAAVPGMELKEVGSEAAKKSAEEARKMIQGEGGKTKVDGSRRKEGREVTWRMSGKFQTNWISQGGPGNNGHNCQWSGLLCWVDQKNEDSIHRDGTPGGRGALTLFIEPITLCFNQIKYIVLQFVSTPHLTVKYPRTKSASYLPQTTTVVPLVIYITASSSFLISLNDILFFPMGRWVLQLWGWNSLWETVGSQLESQRQPSWPRQEERGI